MSKPASSPDAGKRISDLRLAGRILRYARPYKKILALALFLVLVMTLAMNMMPVLIRRIIDHWLVAPDLLEAERFQGLTRTVLGILGLAVLGVVARYAQGCLTTWVGQQVVVDLRRDVVKRLLHFELETFGHTPVGRLMTRATSDVESMQMLVTEGLVSLIADICMLLGILTFMLYLNATLAAVVLLGVLPALFCVLYIINRHLRSAHRQQRTEQSALNAFLQEALTGMGTIQLFNRQQRTKNELHERNEHYMDSCFRASRWMSLFFPTLEAGQALSVLLTVGVGTGMVLLGWGGVTLGVVVAFLAYVRDFFRPLSDLSNKWSTFQQALAAGERIFEILDTPVQLPDPKEAVALPEFKGHIRFNDVTFSYGDGPHVLHGLSFEVPAGHSFAIVGHTGAGKSTIINLLARYYDVDSGSIELDGLDVRAYPKAVLRSRVGVIPQEPFVFADTLLNNIGLWDERITAEHSRQAAHFVRAHEFIENLPQGYDTELGERGATLSTGQKQLLALSRVFARGGEHVLVLDEATASIDTATEVLIQKALDSVTSGRTSILIAHRLSTIMHADQILVMNKGRIAEQGTHRNLVALDGLYAHLCRLLD